MRPKWLPHLPSRITSLLALLGSLALLLAIVSVRANQDRSRDVDDRQQAGNAHGHGNDDSALIGIHKIKHVIIIMQENRSFDTYFGTYPGADGIPKERGQFTVCVPDPRYWYVCQALPQSQRSRMVAVRTAPAMRWQTSTAARWMAS